MTVPKKEQNAGVALLLERMKTNPEEFLEGGKWGALINRFERYFSDEDAKALSNAIDELMQQQFTEKVLEELVDPKPSKLEQLLQAKLKNTPSAGATLTLSSGAGNVNLQEHMQAHINKIKEHPEAKTIFGRLFNYS
jgi:hypothetical protein